MSGKGPGATAFEGMSHEQMLAWLDQANSGTVQSAADRLTAAAKEIRKIGEELKVRPQHVDWKGEGADAFRGWAADLANSTLRLGDFSDDAAKWLGQASNAIAHAQASIPRESNSARANLDAVTLSHYDPDATTVHTKSASELAALAAVAANKEKVRQEAASQMLKLGQSYRLSATQLEGLERPAFPPPPTELQPAVGKRDENVVVSAGGAGSRTTSTGGPARDLPLAGVSPATSRAVDDTGPGPAIGEARPHTTVQRPSPDASDQVAVKVDSAQALPQPSALPVSPLVPSDESRTVGTGSLPMGTMPTTMPGGVRNSSSIPSGTRAGTGTGRTPTGGRAVAQPARGAAGPGPLSRRVPGTAVEGGPTGTARPVTGGRPAGPLGRESAQPTTGRATGSRSSNGITGGRPTSPAAGSPTGRRAGGLPRGTVIGGETDGTTGRGPAGQSSSTGRSSTGRSSTGTGGTGAGQRATSAGRRGTGDGVVGGRPQPQGRSGARPFTSGGSGLVRNQDSGGTAPAPGPTGRADTRPSGSRSSNAQRNGEQDRRTGGQDRRNGERDEEPGDRSEEPEPGQPIGRWHT
ncbi:translation initiation factor IF-2 [Streptomyces sp. NPDC050528]|uniref:translation initiation factor IF-2 n=1 Tax=unclassified Streptomyces TaxID=2593676 RepID=UPI0037B3C1C3